jgi:hypothetical protein
MPPTSYDLNKLTNGLEFSKLLTAAVINSGFRHLLLTDPRKALASGFNGEAFLFEKVDRERIIAIKANSLSEFASQLTEKPGEPNYRHPVKRWKEQPAFVSISLV